MNRADRKKQLIAQGALYRAELLLAKEAAHASLQPDSLAKSALHQVARSALAIFRRQNLTGLAGLAGGNLQTALPLVITGISALAKRKHLLKPVLLAGAVAGVVALVMKKKKAGHTAADMDFVGPE
ncbi:hypothetical protein [Noviherbaspirillum sp.]|uniref:hypothetical protein n=1 Tax=Noviherbaspirillum sp. TaxID=1926288 RepID=UPI0025D87F28|nr:hypothetical protein [Noviherbaspirillum sp.]